MPSPTHTAAGTLARELLARHPAATSLMLARMLRRDHPEVFHSVQQARCRICYYRGAAGKKNQHHSRPTVVPAARRTRAQSDEARVTARLAVPPSSAEPWHPYTLATGDFSVAILADIHVPYHDVRAVTAAIDQAARRRPDFLLLNGDITDCHTISKWEKDPRKRQFRYELDTTSDLIRYIRHRMPRTSIRWKLGNHEDRYFHFMRRRAPELIGLPEFEPEAVFGLRAHGAEIIGEQRVIHAGKLSIIHGHEYPAAVLSPVNAARGYFLRAKTSILGSHYHQKSEHNEPNIRGSTIGAWSTGCLCDLHPEYARLNRWSHGWAFVEVASDGSFEVDNIRIA